MRQRGIYLKYIILTSLAFAVATLCIGKMPQVLTIMGLSLSGIYFIKQRIDKENRTAIIVLFLVTFFLAVALSIFMYNQTVHTKYCGFSYKGDDYIYGDFGTIVGGLWRQGIFPDTKGLTYYNLIGKNVDLQIYQLYNALIFYLFGACGGQIPLIINAFFHALIVIPVYIICRDLDIRTNATNFVIALFLFWPSTFCWSLFNFKEPMFLLGTFAAFSLFAALRKNPSFKNLIFLLLSIFVVYALKKYFAVLFIILFLYLVFLWKWRYKNIFVLICLCALIVIQLLTGAFLPDLYAKLSDLPRTIWGIRYHGRIGAASYFEKFLTFTYPRTVLYLPLGILASLFLPFLLRPYTAAQIAANMESIGWWLLMPFLVSGIWISVTREFKKTFPFLAIFFYWLGIAALTQVNMGTLIRQKSIIYYIGFIFIGLAIDRVLKGGLNGGKS